jgi:ATP-dependent protease HslVU (ClpYQ) peptidase subunit
MTTIVGVQGRDFAVLACDSRVFDEDSGRYFTMTSDTCKIVECDEFLIGCAGDLRVINALTFFDPPIVPDDPDKLDLFISSEFADTLKSHISDVCGSSDSPTSSGPDYSLLVAVRGRVYEIGSAMEWCRDVSGVYAVGTGSQYALGAMRVLVGRGKAQSKTIGWTQKAVERALDAAIAFDNKTGGPIVVISQDLTM